MTTSTTLSAIEPGLNALEFTREATLKLAAEITDEQMLHRPTPEANHTAWLLGHIAYADNGFRSKLSGSPSVIPESYEALFGMGSTPSDDASIYPSKAELLKTMEKSHTALIEWFKSLSDEQLAESLPEDMEKFGANYATLASTLIWHEGLHAGQLVEVRRSLGLPRAFG